MRGGEQCTPVVRVGEQCTPWWVAASGPVGGGSGCRAGGGEKCTPGSPR